MVVPALADELEHEAVPVRLRPQQVDGVQQLAQLLDRHRLGQVDQQRAPVQRHRGRNVRMLAVGVLQRLLHQVGRGRLELKQRQAA